MLTGLFLFSRPGSGIQIFQANGATDGCEDVSTGVRLAEVTGATGGLGLRTRLGILVRRDEDYRGAILNRGKSSAQIHPGHPFELDVEYQTIKPRMLLIGEERLGGGVSDRLKVRGPQKPTERVANALVIINDRDVDILAAAHRIG